jgi:hypothetical protein
MTIIYFTECDTYCPGVLFCVHILNKFHKKRKKNKKNPQNDLTNHKKGYILYTYQDKVVYVAG